MPTIAITTDFGLKDGNVGVMKGVIWGICPQVHIADVSHLIGAQDIREASLILARSAPYFPPGTIQLVVVDPGVGTARRPMAARIGTGYYVGPDNGILTYWLEHARAANSPLEFVNLDQPDYWLPEVSHVFHGRDIFAPVAAHLAAGVALPELGTPLLDPVQFKLPRPRRVPGGWAGEVIHVDHFGNACTNIRAKDLEEAIRDPGRLEVQLGDARIRGLVNTFGEREKGQFAALIGSTGNLLVAVVNGNAASTLGVRVGDVIHVRMLGNHRTAGGEA